MLRPRSVRCQRPNRQSKKHFPNLAKWVQGYGWIEIGEQEQFAFVSKALDAGGLIYEDDRCNTLPEAMMSMEVELSGRDKKQGTA